MWARPNRHEAESIGVRGQKSFGASRPKQICVGRSRETQAEKQVVTEVDTCIVDAGAEPEKNGGRGSESKIGARNDGRGTEKEKGHYW